MRRGHDSRRVRRGAGLVVPLLLAAVLGTTAPAVAATEPVANGVTAHRGAPDHGPSEARVLAAGVVGMAATGNGGGYWQVAGDGGVFSFGDARFHGSAGAIPLARPVVGIAARSDGGGYWLAASDGGVFAYGAARFHGSMGGVRLNRPVVGIAATPSGNGYWLVASDGGIFSFGDASFHGSTGNMALARPVVGMAATRSGGGYWLVAADGGVFAFGDARFRGSTGDRDLEHPVVAMAASPQGDAYWLAGRDGRVFGFGVEAHEGPSGSVNVRQAPTVAIAAHPGGGYWLSYGAPYGVWEGGTIFPRNRIVAHYGTSRSAAMGILGRGTPEQALQRLMERVSAFGAGSRPVIPAFEYIATIALNSPGPGGLYRNPAPISEIRPYLEAIRRVDGLLILDIQPGRGDWLSEVRRYEELLREPDVGLALDPEWAVGPTGRPGGGHIGSMDAADVNRVSAYLADLVQRHGLPEKVLMVHRFRESMVTNDHLVVGRPGLAIVFHADGIGSPRAKLGDYHGGLPDRFARGFKVFLDEDPVVMSPAELLALDPPPDVVTYQ